MQSACALTNVCRSQELKWRWLAVAGAAALLLRLVCVAEVYSLCIFVQDNKVFTHAAPHTTGVLDSKPYKNKRYKYQCVDLKGSWRGVGAAAIGSTQIIFSGCKSSFRVSSDLYEHQRRAKAGSGDALGCKRGQAVPGRCKRPRAAHDEQEQPPPTSVIKDFPGVSHYFLSSCHAHHHADASHRTP